MVASDHSLTVEGAGMFSHALSTHRAENDIDFFSAVDDLQEDPTVEDEDRAGSGMIGNAGVYLGRLLPLRRAEPRAAGE